MNERNLRLKGMYDISENTYLFLLEEQNSVCKICKRKERIKLNGKIKHLCVDHCSITGHIRGLLCGSCNTAIGYLEHNITMLNNAIMYLQEFESNKARIKELDKTIPSSFPKQIKPIKQIVKKETKKVLTFEDGLRDGKYEITAQEIIKAEIDDFLVWQYKQSNEETSFDPCIQYLQGTFDASIGLYLPKEKRRNFVVAHTEDESGASLPG